MSKTEIFMNLLSEDYYQTKEVLMRRMGVGLTSIDRYVAKNYNNLAFVYVSDGGVGRAKLAIKRKKGADK